MEAGFSRMNDLIVIQASQVRISSLPRRQNYTHVSRVCVRTCFKAPRIHLREELWLAMTIDITLSDGHNLQQQHL